MESAGGTAQVFVGICNSQESVPADFFWSFVTIRPVCPVVVFRASHPWDIVRNNQIIAKFLSSGCSYLAKMDIDQQYPDNYFERLLPLAEKHKVVGPLIHDRWDHSGYMPLAFTSHEHPRLRPMDLSGLSGVVEVPYAHTNMIYSREVLASIPPPWYEARASVDGLERANHVDFDFIDKIHKAGYKTYVDLDTVVGHLATVPIIKTNRGNIV
jgi:hypothetical protein